MAYTRAEAGAGKKKSLEQAVADAAKRAAAVAAEGAENRETGPTPKQVNEAYVKLLAAQGDYKKAAQKQKDLRKSLSETTMNYWLRSTVENKQGNLYRLSRDYARAGTLEEADGIRERFDKERGELGRLLTANQNFYSDAVNGWNKAAADKQAAARRIEKTGSDYSRLINAYRLDRRELSSGVREELYQRERQAEAEQKNAYEQRLAKVDRRLNNLVLNPNGYIDPKAEKIGGELRQEKAELENGLYSLERYGTAAEMEQKAQNDPEFQRYAQAGKKTIEGNRHTTLLGGGDTSWYREYNAMTSQQKAVYDYYAGKEGDSAAQAYKAQLQSDIHAAMAEDYLKRVQEGAEQDPAGYGVASLITTPIASAYTTADMISGAVEPKSQYSHYADPNTPGQVMTRGNQLARQIGLEGIENPYLRGAGELGYTIADMAPSVALSAAGLPGLGGAYMGALAGTGDYTDVTPRGVTQGQALAYGVTSGVVSSWLEKSGIDNIAKAFAGGKHTATQIIRGMLGSFVSEGSEEAAEDLAQVIYDRVINGTKSSRNLAKQQYMAQGLSEEEAEKRSWEDVGADTWKSFIMGGLAGGIMSGGGYLGGAALSKIDQGRARKVLLDGGILSEEEYSALMEGQESAAGSEGMKFQPAPKYSLTPYSDHQKENWANSKSIVLYENQEQFNQFISEAVQTKGTTGKKMYFGMVEGELADRIKAETGIDVTGYNLTLAASEVQKILNDHGNPNTEIPRGQRAITVEDFQDIPRIIQEADSIQKGSTKYEGHEVLKFQKEVNGKTTVVTYQIGSNHDLRVQTMYSGQNKRSLATTPGGTMSFPHTSETLSGTASFTHSIPNSSENVNYPAPFGMDPIEWGRRMRSAASAKTSLERTAALYDVAPEVYAAAERLAKETGARIVFDGTLRGNENGYYQNGEIHINPNAEGSFAAVFAHELTHHLEGTGSYQALSDYVLSCLGGEDAVSRAIEQKITEYDRSSSGRVKLSEADARAELVAEYISESLFTNEGEILRLARSDLSLAQRVKNFISRLAAKVTGNTEKQFLLNAERLYQRAIEEAKRNGVQAESESNRKLSVSPEQQNAVDKAVRMLDNGSTPNEVYAQTGLVVMANGDIFDKMIGGKKIGEYQHGNAQDELGGISENVQSAFPGNNRGRNQGGLGESSAAVRLQIWNNLEPKSRQRIIEAIELKMKNTSEEGKAVIERFGGIEPFTERFYSMLQQGRPVAEQLSNLIPDIQGLMNEIEAAAGEPGGRKYSLSEKEGAAPDPDYQQMVNKYGAIPEGEKPHGREAQVPASTDGKDAVSQYARTLMEAPQTPDEFLPAFRQQVENGLFSHKPVRDKDSLDRAARVLEKYGWQEGMKRWQQVVDDEHRATKDDIVLAQVMYAEAAKVGDLETAQRLVAEIATEGTLAGQEVQALRLLKRTTPEGRLYYLQKTAKALQDGLERKLGKKWKDKIEIDKDLAQKYLDAQTEEDRAKALNDLYDDVARQLPRTREDICNAWRYFAMLGNPRTHIRNVVGNVAFQAPVRIKNKVGAVLELSRPRDERTKSLYTTKAAREFAKADYGKMADAMGGGKYSEMQEIKSRQRVLPGWVDKASKLNSKALEAEDALFKRMTYINSMAQFLTARRVDVNSINENTLEQARSYAMNEALRATFNDASALANAINRLERMNGASKFIVGGLVPFKRTPVNIVKRGIEYSPVGLIKGITYDAVQVRKGLMSATDMIDHISAGLTGSGIVALGMFLRAVGWISGEGDEDDKKRYFDEAQGEQSYSLNIGDYSYTIDWAAPAALPLFVGVELWDALQDSAKGELTFKSVLESTEKLFNPVLELTMMSGVSDTLQSAVYSPEGMMSAALTSVGTSYLGQFVPTLFGQIARTINPVSRSTYHEGDSPLPKSIDKFLQKQANKIPGLSQNQIPYMDVWGRSEVNENTALRAFENFLSPGYVDKKSSSPGEQELLRLYQATGNSAVLPGRAQSTLTIDGEKVYLKAGEYAQYATERGRSSLKILNQAAENPMYQSMDDLTRADFIQRLYQYADQTAKGKFTSFVPENWVEGVQVAVKAGIPADTAIAYRVLAADMDSGEKLELMEGIELPDEKKRLLYEKTISEDHGERIDAVLDAGLGFDDYLNIQKEYGMYYNDDTLDAGDKATEFSRWFDQQYDVDGAAKIKEQFKFFSFAPAESKYDKFTATGMSEDGAYALNNALSELVPLDGKEKVSDAQRLAEIVFSGNYQKEDVEAALSVAMGDQYAKLETAQEAGISTEAFMDYYLGARGLGSDKDENGKAIKGRGEKVKQMTYIDDIPGLNVEQKDAIYRTNKDWAESTLDEAPWHGGPRYEGELPEHYSVNGGGTAPEGQPAEKPSEDTGDPSGSDEGGSSGGNNGGSAGQRRNGGARAAVQQSGKVLRTLLSDSVSPSLPKSQGTLNTGIRSGTRARSLTLPTIPRVVRAGTKGKYAKRIITPYDEGQILSRALANTPDGKLKKL